MAPVRKSKRASGANATVELKVPVETSSPSTPQRSPIRKRRGGVTLQQKQAMIDNLQLEITERARRLRAQYNLQAQGLRSRIEIRINRIPMSLRKLKMGDLLLKYQEQEEKRAARPPVPAKDHPTRSRPATAGHGARPAGRGHKRMSDAIMDKENEFEHAENAKKRIRAAHTTEARAAAILSPTSSNSRLAANRSRPASPNKSSGIARPASPLKSSTSRSVAASSVLSSMVEKAKATRAETSTRKTTNSNTSSGSNSTAAAPATRRRAATTTGRAPASRPTTRNGRRVSNHSETSEASTGTVVKRSAASKSAPARKGVMDSIRKGVSAGTKKKTTKSTASASASTAGTGRVLRKRN